MKEYAIENGKEVDLEQLKTGFVKEEDYVIAHKNTVILCHDVLIKYDSGILLVVRDNVPAKDILWPIGGRVLRGVPTEESLRRKVKVECGLDLENIRFVGCGRTIFRTEPFGHGKGTDTLNLMFVADGIGELNLDNLHNQPLIVTTEMYTEEFKKKLHSYVRDFVDKVF